MTRMTRMTRMLYNLLDADSSEVSPAAVCLGVSLFSLTLGTTAFTDCPTLNGVLAAVADGVLNIIKFVLICEIDSADGANTAGGFT